ncbi:amidohydrolase [Limobrevibacterium gyesilva]|uniref:Amidohydrolase n=1 Tax=Limobrevibacterium gyesilva TaxID=2991712 RepID=A0AA41YJ57_9PROT|nr:amidohydrolase [Limobrevibacterium gyesilva]MCW3474644.1 amidohydrolase [Limobrevibacterium gyesilva]
MRLTDARLADGSRVDVTVAEGRIAAIAPHAGQRGEAHLAGALLLPGLVDGHVHLDKTLLGLPWRPHAAAGTVRDRIEYERAHRRGLALPVQDRAAALLRQMTGFGTTALRTHVDIDDAIGLDNFHAVMETVAAYRDRADIQVVAFPQSGIVTRPGVAELLDEALRAGADLVGGLDPVGIDGDAAGHLDVVFGLAQRHGSGIDIHLHDPGPVGNAQLRDIAARTRAAGMGGQVTVSHAFSLGTPDADDFAATADALADAGVAILTSAPGAATMPPVQPLRARGVAIFAGSDNIRDLWSPFGNGDMLERAFLVAQRQGFRTDEDIAVAFETCSVVGARVLGLEDHGIHVGGRADLVAVRAETLAEAVAMRPAGRMVWKAGRLIAPIA